MDAKATAPEVALVHVMTHVLAHAKDAGTVVPINKRKAPTLCMQGLSFLFPLIFELKWQIKNPYRVAFISQRI